MRCGRRESTLPPFPDFLSVMIMQHPARTELWAILRLSGPLIASQLAHMLMVLTDTLMMARISPQALAGGAWVLRATRSCRFFAWA